MTENQQANSLTRASVIQSVRTPLGFFTLAVLVVEAILGLTAYFSQGQDRTYLIVGMLVLIFLLVVIVAGMAVFRPEALSGVRPAGVVAIPTVSNSTSASPLSKPEAKQGSVEAGAVDPKLIYFTPPFKPSQFRIVDLPQQYPLKYYSWPYAPTGLTTFHGIPFFLQPVQTSDGSPAGHVVIDLQPIRGNHPKSETLQVRTENVSRIHFLLSAGHGWRVHEGVQFLYQQIGLVEMAFAGGTQQTINLVLGNNIREWAFGNSPHLVTELDIALTKPAWLSHDRARRIDLMSVDILGGPKTINTIRVEAKFSGDLQEKRIDTPAIIISAITLERAIEIK